MGNFINNTGALAASITAILALSDYYEQEILGLAEKPLKKEE